MPESTPSLVGRLELLSFLFPPVCLLTTSPITSLEYANHKLSQVQQVRVAHIRQTLFTHSCCPYFIVTQAGNILLWRSTSHCANNDHSTPSLKSQGPAVALCKAEQQTTAVRLVQKQADDTLSKRRRSLQQLQLQYRIYVATTWELQQTHNCLYRSCT
jgi:hypothetical protein